MQEINIIALICGIYFLIAFITTSILKKYSFKKEVLSKYALGKYSWIMFLAFLATITEEFLLGFQFIQEDSVFSGLFLIIAGIGMCLVTFIRYEGSKNKRKIHEIGAMIQFISFPLALLSLYIMNQDKFSLIIGSITIILATLIIPLNKEYLKGKITNYGLIQKINILLMDFWLIITPAVRLFW